MKRTARCKKNYTYRSVFGLESIERTNWTSHRSPYFCLTQPSEHTSPSRLTQAELLPPPLPLLNQSQRAGKNSYSRLWLNRYSSHRHSGTVAHFRLQDSDWLPCYANANSYTNTHIALQPPFSHSLETCTHCMFKKKCIWNYISRCSSCLFLMSLSRKIFTPPQPPTHPHLHGSVVQLFHQQPNHIHAPYCGEAEEYATCHSRLILP